MYKKINNTFLYIILIGNIALLIITYFYSNQNNYLKNHFANTQKRLEYKYFRNMQYEGISLQNASEIFGDSVALCYYISNLHCAPCIDSTLVSLIKAKSKYNLNIKILTNTNSKILKNRFKRINNIKCEIISVNNFDLPLFHFDTPVFFLYNPNIKIAQMIFSPDIKKNSFTTNYLKIVSIVVKERF